MDLIMSDVDEVFRRLTDGHDYLELGLKIQNSPLVKSYTSISKATDVTNDFQTFRAQLANFLRNKKSNQLLLNHHDNRLLMIMKKMMIMMNNNNHVNVILNNFYR